MITAETTPIVAFKEFFGLKTGQTLMQFKAEIDQLTDEDHRAEIAAGLEANGYKFKAATPK